MKISPQRILLGIEYLGTRYHGWQRQKHVISVQSELEKVLSEIASHPVSTICAGRTDRGVHATSQYVHFDVETVRPLKAWLKGGNTLLQDDVSIFSATEVDTAFDARRTAVDRTYVYLIHNYPLPRAGLSAQTTWISQYLDVQPMHLAAQALLGEQDFSAFRSAHCQSRSVHRNMKDISVRRCDDLVVIELTANAFLHHMVRNIVGSLMDIGRGIQPIDWMAELLMSKDRTLAGVTAPPNGLFLARVRYPEKYNLTAEVKYPLHLATEFSPSRLL